MYKNIIFILLFSFSLISFSQDKQTYDLEYKATYLMTFRPDSLDTLKEKEKAYLSFNDSLSVFRSDTKHRKDSTRYQYLFGKSKPTGGTIWVLGKSREDNLIIKEGDEIKTFENLSIVDRNDVNYFFEESKKDQQWEIKEDTATIKGYLCQNAVLEYGNRRWAAWFTEEVPVSDGPYRFSGLPGLIIQIEDQTNSWGFELLSIVKVPQKIVVNFDEAITYKKIEKPGFYKKKKYLLDNIAHLKTGSSGEGEARIESLAKKVEKVRKKDNNWIELYP